MKDKLRAELDVGKINLKEYLDWSKEEMETGVPVYPKNCHEWMEDSADYHKKIIKEITPYITDFIHVLLGEGATNYYSKSQNKVVEINELNDIQKFLINESYG